MNHDDCKKCGMMNVGEVWLCSRLLMAVWIEINRCRVSIVEVSVADTLVTTPAHSRAP